MFGTQGSQDYRSKLAALLANQGLDSSPISSPWQGADRMAKALLAGWQMQGVDAQNQEGQKWMGDFLTQMGGGQSPQQPAAPSGQPASPGIVAALAPKSDRVYREDEFNPLDAKVASPQELAHGVPSFVPDQYRPVMGKAAVDQDLPVDLLARQTKQESGFNPNAVSSAGARGISQFMPATAREMGINPQDPNQAIPAQAAYLRQNIDKFGGSTPLGLAAYNWGPGNVQDWLKGGGDVSKMPAETQGYIRNIAGQQPQAPQQMAQAPGANPAMLAKLQEGINSPNPVIQKQARELAMPLITQMFKPAEWDISARPDGAVQAVNKRNPSDIRIVMPPGRDQQLIDFDAKKDATVKVAGIRAEREARDAMPASFEDTAKVRGEIRSLPSYKNISEAAPIYKTMVDSAGRNSRASDLNLVYGLGKIFDPGSVVREGEMVMVKNTAGIPDWLVGTINSLNGGAALTPETRKAIMAEAFSRMQSYQQLFDQESGMYRGVAERNRMRPEDVIPQFGPFAPWEPQPAPVSTQPTQPTQPVKPTREQAIEELKRRGRM
jgi:soluble lytic murein transglycosylase-like protein